MSRIFAYDSPITTFLTRLGELLILNLLWLICCIPVFTIGPSTTAMNAVAHQLVLDECPGVIKEFFRFFRRDFKQAFFLGLIFVAVCAVLGAEIYWVISLSRSDTILVIWCIAAVFMCFIFSYAFPLMAHFDNTLFRTLKNAMILSIGRLPRTIALCILNLLPLLMALFWTQAFLIVLPFWLVLGCSVICYLDHLLLRPLFEKLQGE